MLEISVLPPGIEAVQQQSFYRAEGINNRALLFTEIRALEFVEGFGPRLGRVGAE